jgi:hypothetical protein
MYFGPQHDDALAPQPARPPVHRIDQHQADKSREQHHHQRPVPDPGERRRGHDRLGRPVQQLQHDRVGADQPGPERQQQQVVQAAERDGRPAGDVGRPRLAGPRQPRIAERLRPFLARSLGRLRTRGFRALAIRVSHQVPDDTE